MKQIKSAYLLKITVVFVLLLAFCAPTFAQFGSRPEIKIGMTKSEVQARWGEPQRMTDKSLLAESTWQFEATEKLPEQSVEFRSNKLTNIIGGNPYPDLSKTHAKKIAKSPVAQAFMPIVSQKDLTEVLKQVPSEEDNPKEANPAQSPAKFN